LLSSPDWIPPKQRFTNHVSQIYHPSIGILTTKHYF
jgi:hypothetical protein